MFTKYSMAGLGNYIKLASALYIIAQMTGFAPETEASEEIITTIAVALYVAGEFWSQIGTFLREDLKFGIKRKEPLE